MHLDAHERALRAANQCLRPFGVALQHLSFGPLEGLVLEVFDRPAALTRMTACAHCRSVVGMRSTAVSTMARMCPS